MSIHARHVEGYLRHAARPAGGGHRPMVVAAPTRAVNVTGGLRSLRASSSAALRQRCPPKIGSGFWGEAVVHERRKGTTCR
eukprot:9032808-Pyramimonas_sp.AAC.1